LLILVDAMGGDNAPKQIVNGCIDAVEESEGFDILLIGDGKQINEILKKRKYNKSRINIEHAPDTINNDDIPTKSIRNKTESSMVVGFNLLKEKKGDAFLSAGNSGALMAGALFILGRIKGVDRPALATIIPTRTGMSLLIDAGLNPICKPINYYQFGIMGSIYMQQFFNIPNPKVGLVNVGAEEKKGNIVIQQAFDLLGQAPINFIGNIEGRQIPLGKADVIVCDGFVGNVLLKFLEGIGSFIKGTLKEMYSRNFLSKASALFVRKDLKKISKRMDYEEYGGTPLLGVNGLVIKSHGSSSAKAIKNAVIKCSYFAKNCITNQILEALNTKGVEGIV